MRNTGSPVSENLTCRKLSMYLFFMMSRKRAGKKRLDMESIPTLRMPERRMLSTTRLAVKPREPLDFDLPNMWEIVCGSPQ
jgi:hypothetical protein